MSHTNATPDKKKVYYPNTGGYLAAREKELGVDPERFLSAKAENKTPTKKEVVELSNTLSTGGDGSVKNMVDAWKKTNSADVVNKLRALDVEYDTDFAASLKKIDGYMQDLFKEVEAIADGLYHFAADDLVED